MSTNNFETCENCGSNTYLKLCAKCELRVCKECFQNHGNLCKRIQEYMIKKGDQCTFHKGCNIVSFCLECSIFLCEQCTENHEIHKTNVQCLTTAVCALKEQIPKVTSDNENKIFEADRYIQSFPEKSKQINEITDFLANHISKTKRIIDKTNKYRTHIDSKCLKLESFKAFLGETCKLLNSLQRQSNPHTFLLIWNGINNEISLEQTQIASGCDDKSVFDKLHALCRTTKMNDALNEEVNDIKVFEQIIKQSENQWKKKPNFPKQLGQLNTRVDEIKGLRRDKFALEQTFDIQQREHSSERTKSEEEIKTLRSLNTDLKLTLDKLQNENKDLQKRVEELEGLKAEKLELEQKFEIHQKQHNAERAKYEEKVQILQSLNSNVNAALEKLQKENYDLEERYAGIERLVGEKVELERKLEIQQKEHSSERAMYDEEVKKLKILNTNLKESLTKGRVDHKSLQERCSFGIMFEKKVKELQTLNTNVKVTLDESQKENKDIKERAASNFDQLLNEKDNKIEDCETKIKQLESVITSKQTVLDNLSKECKQLKEREREAVSKYEFDKYEMNKRCKQMAGMEKKIHSLKSEKDELQTRLSSFAGDKLTRGNPAITDLADPNRPMKIGERYGELYDNDWTDAMEKVESMKKYFPDKDRSDIEEILIHYLHRILRCCYVRCLETVSTQIKQVVSVLGIDVNESYADLPEFKDLIAYRNCNAERFAHQLAQKKAFCDTMLDKWEYHWKHEGVMDKLVTFPFYKKCVELCWCMAIKDPPMYLDEDIPPGTVMDKNTYREFTKSGEIVEYVVWPALRLHKDGPVLYKGVIQVK